MKIRQKIAGILTAIVCAAGICYGCASFLMADAVPSFVTKYGDLNNDDVSVSDVVKLNLYLLNNTENPLDAASLANADCVRDGIIDSSDSSLIMNYIAMMVDYDKLGTL